MFYPTGTEYPFSSSAHGTFPRIDHIQDPNQVSINVLRPKWKKTTNKQE
jgi:hypothetical protein